MTAPEALVADQATFDALCDRWASAEVVGVDTEYLTDRRFFPELCLIQVASDDVAALIDPLSDLDLRSLRRVLDGAGPVVVMHNAAADAPILVRATGVAMGRVFDTMVAAGFLGAGELSLSAVVQRYLNVILEKGATLSDWSLRPLSDHALHYALDDVVHLPPLWRLLRDQLQERGRVGWARTR